LWREWPSHCGGKMDELRRSMSGASCGSRWCAVACALLLLVVAACSCGANASAKVTIASPYNFAMTNRIVMAPHAHTTKSDGKDSTAVVIERYASAGYSALAITDHNIVNWPWPVHPPGLIPVPGDEVSKFPALQNFHITSLFCDYVPKDPNLNAQGTINAIDNDGGIAVIAHPYFSMKSVTDVAGLKDYNGLEIYNRSSEIISNRGYSLDIWDYVLSNTPNRKVWGYAVDDYHFDPSDFNRGRIVVIAPYQTSDDIKNALQTGSFYAMVGTGTLHFENIAVSGQTLQVTTDQPADITFIGYRGKPLSGKTNARKADYKIVGNEKYVRVQAVASNGATTVYSNPIAVDAVP
jgi:hypothetical protein